MLIVIIFFFHSFLAESKLSCNATVLEIFDAMKHPITGVSFLGKAQSLPSFTFILWDAIHWIQTHVEGNANALEILEAMRMFVDLLFVFAFFI